MKLFLSYRRDDSGGRAGRLFDTLVARYGHDHVFQDVNTVEPGVNFIRQVETAITRSDAVLVVIGPHWLSSPSPDGGRRIDHPDDFVRRELGFAIEADVRVVPVLVDGATLPQASELPESLVPLLERQAVSIRDVSWHQDVDDLIRRLEGEPRVAEGSRRRRHFAVGGVGLITAIVVGAIVIASRGDDPGSSSTEPPPCTPPTSSWDTVPLVDEPFLDVTKGDRSLRIEVQRVALNAEPDGTTRIVVDLQIDNTTDPSIPNASYYYAYSDFNGLFIDGISHDEGACADVLAGLPDLAPTEAVRARVGYSTEIETDDALFQLKFEDGAVTINAP